MNRRQFLKLVAGVPVAAAVSKLPPKLARTEVDLLRSARVIHSRIDSLSELDFRRAYENCWLDNSVPSRVYVSLTAGRIGDTIKSAPSSAGG